MPEEFSMSSKDIANIVKSCAEAGVTEFHFGQLKILFGSRDKEISQPDQQFYMTDFAVNEPSPQSTDSSPTSKKYDDSELEVLQITNPALWEEIVMQEDTLDG